MTTAILTPPPATAPTAAEIGGVLAAYRIVGAGEVQAFLERHSFLLPLLREAPEQIWRHFPGAGLRLEVCPDMETVGRATLFLEIETMAEVEAAVCGLDAVRRDWWFSRARQAQAQMEVSLTFVPSLS